MEYGVMDSARAAVARMSPATSEPAHISMILSMMLLKSAKPNLALSELQRVLVMEPGHPHASLMAARVLAAEGRIDEAVEILKAVPPGSGRWTDTLSLQGALLMKSKRYAEAVGLFGQARSSQPMLKEHLLNLVRALRAAGQTPRARSELILAIARWPDDAHLKFNSALVSMKDVLLTQPNHAGALNYIGFSWAQQGRHLPEAEELIRRALSIEPDNGAILDSLGWVLYRQGRLKLAESTLRRALVLEPNHGEIYFHLAMVLRSRRKIEEARIVFEQAIEHAGNEIERGEFRRTFGEEVL
jgi:Flp pilus assembly protein TadD